MDWTIDRNQLAQIAAMLAAVQQAQAQRPSFPAPAAPPEATKSFWDTVRESIVCVRPPCFTGAAPEALDAIQTMLSRRVQPERAGEAKGFRDVLGRIQIVPCMVPPCPVIFAPATAPDAAKAFGLSPEQQKGFWDVLQQAGQLAAQYGPQVYSAVQSILSKGMQPAMPYQQGNPSTGGALISGFLGR